MITSTKDNGSSRVTIAIVVAIIISLTVLTITIMLVIMCHCTNKRRKQEQSGNDDAQVELCVVEGHLPDRKGSGIGRNDGSEVESQRRSANRTS